MGSESLLLVSDDADYVAHFMALPDSGRFRVVRSMSETADVLGKVSFDVVLIDLDLTGARDPLLVREIRDLSPGSVVVALVSGEPGASAEEAHRAGAEDCLSKQGDDRTRVRELVRRARVRARAREQSARRARLLEDAFVALSPNIAVVDERGVIVLSNESWDRFCRENGGDPARCATGADYLDVLRRAARVQPEVARVLDGFSAVLAGESSHFRDEARCDSPTQQRWFLMQVDRMPGARRGVVVTHTDITERKRIEEALARSEVGFRTLLERFPHGLAIDSGGEVVWINRVLAEALGYSDVRELVGSPTVGLVQPQDQSVVRERLSRVAEGKVLGAVVARLRRKNGADTLAEVSAFPIHFEGKPSALVIQTDPDGHGAVTAELMQMERMHSVGLLALGLGHEINNPLSLVTANVDLAFRRTAALQRLATGPSAINVDRAALELLFDVSDGLREVREVLGEAREGARRIREIVADLRTFSRPEEESLGPVNVERILDAAVGVAGNEIRHRARLVKLYSAVPAVVGNEARLGQVFLNLLVNAAQAIPVGAADRNEIRLETFVSEGQVIVQVSDTGAGIAPEHLSRLFEPFFTTKGVGQGTGLGLAICRDIVMKVGGTIQVESTPGRGSVFRVALVPSVIPAPTRPPSSDHALRAESNKMRVLVVDDEPLMGRVIQRCFGKAHEVHWVPSGREALTRLEGPEHWDVVFLDVMMPEMTGIELYEALHAQTSRHLERVVFLTGGAFAPGGEEALAKTGRARISKPFEARDLLAVARAVVHGHNPRDE